MVRLSIAIGLLVVATHANGATLNQYVDPPLGTGSADHLVGRGERYAQVFTARYTGTLKSIDLYVFGSPLMAEALQVDILSTVEGKPSDSLSHTAVTADDVPRRSELPGSLGTYDAWDGEWLSVDVPTCR